MIFPFILLIANIMLWYLLSQVALLGEPLLNIGMFALVFGASIWVMLEVIDLVRNVTKSKTEDE